MKNSTKIVSLIMSLLISLSVFNIVPVSVSAAESDSFADGATPDEAWNVIHTGETKTVNIENPDDRIYFKFVAEKDMRVEFSTDHVSDVVHVYMYDQDLYQITMTSAWGSAQIKRFVKAGDTYYFAAKYQDDTTGSFNVTLEEPPIWEYDSYGKDKARLISYNGREADVVIPSEIEGNTVTSIESGAFRGCDTIVSVEMPDTINYMGAYAFESCSNLKTVKLSRNLTSIGESSFSGCIQLESIELPAGITSIGYYAFEDCTSLKSINFPEGLNKIDSYAFMFCYQLADVVIPDTVEEIGDWAFCSCLNLKEVIIGYRVYNIGYNAFGYFDEPGIPKADLTIKGYTGSAAEEYAEENGFNFVSIGQAPPKPTLSFTPKYSYEYVENYYGYWADDLDSEKRSFVYYAPWFNNGDKLSIDYHDERGTVDYYYSSYMSEFKNETGDTIYYSAVKRSRGYGWTVGGENTFTLTYKSMSTEVPVSVVKPEDASIRFIPKKPYELIENTDGYSTSAGFIYYEPSLVKGDKLIVDYGDKTVTYTYGSKSDSSIRYDYGFYDEDGQEIPYNIYSDQDNTPWTLGTNNYFIVTAAGKTTIVPVTIIEYPVESIEFKPASPIVMYENQDGYYYDHISEDGYRRRLQVDENGYYYYDNFTEESEKIYTEPLGFYYTQVPLYKGGNQLIIHNKDGSTKTLTQRFIFTEEDNGYFFVDENGDYDGNVSFDWDGNDNLLTVKYLDTATTVPVTVVENNIESIEYQPVKPIVYNLDDPKDVYDWSIGQKLGYYYNAQKMHDTGSVLIAHFKDGTSKKYTFYAISNIRNGVYNYILGARYYAVDEEGSVIGYSSLTFDYNTSDWTPGNTYYVTVGYLGATTQVPITVISKTAEDPVIGDADGDGVITPMDVTRVQQYLSAMTTDVDEESMIYADVDKNGRIESIDTAWILRYLAGMDIPYKIGQA